MRALLTLVTFLLVFPSLVGAQVDPVRVQIPVDVLQEALTIHDTTMVNIDVRVELVADSAYQAGAEAALAGLRASGAGRGEETPTWARIAWLGVGVASVWVIGHGLNKIANRLGTDVDVDVDVEDNDNVEVVVPPHEPCWPPNYPCKDDDDGN